MSKDLLPVSTGLFLGATDCTGNKIGCRKSHRENAIQENSQNQLHIFKMGKTSSKEKKEEKANENKMMYEEKMEDTHTKYNFLGVKSSERKTTITKTQSVPSSLNLPSRSITGAPPTQALEYWGQQNGAIHAD